MENLKGKTAFITGGASGIGLGIAKACAKDGMNVVIVDMRQDALDEAAAIFKENNWPALCLKLDVTDRAAYIKAADEAEAKFGNLHLLVNNAGIGCAGGPLWEVTPKETDLAIDVNLTAVLNGVQTIVPRMLKHGESSHIVSTSSKAGLIAVPGCGLYNVTKQAVVAIMETLAMDLKDTNIGASVFCPGAFQTNLGRSSREVSAAHLGDDMKAPPPPPPPPKEGEPNPFAAVAELFRSPDDAGERVLRGVKRGDLYILTHVEFKKGVESRGNAMLRAFPDEVPNPKYAEIFPMLVYNEIFDQQSQVPALEKK
ncbi:MAG: SDR family NAD(P)-dependent oxidoreductase [Oscillospiraceae bacterium]|nr:SDR family NAD(P)-dependent oxidoreductase [Oscillospiraceae bacterium]